MPGTNQEIADLAEQVYHQERHVDPGEWTWDDGTTITGEEALGVTRLAAYLYRQTSRAVRNRHQKQAMRFLRSLLTPEQRRRLRTSKDFLVTGSLGGVYRLVPKVGHTDLVVRHGKNWYAKKSYCLHDSREPWDDPMPDADLAIAHMLLIVADEREFLATANATANESMMWNGSYQRRLREARELRDYGVQI